MPAALITETRIDFLHRVSPAGTQRVLQTLQTRFRDGWRGKRCQEEPGGAKEASQGGGNVSALQSPAPWQRSCSCEGDPD